MWSRGQGREKVRHQYTRIVHDVVSTATRLYIVWVPGFNFGDGMKS